MCQFSQWRVQWSQNLLLDIQRLWCDCEKPWRPFSLKGKTEGSHWLSTVGASTSSEVSPPHIVTNPSGMTIVHTPTLPSFHILRQMSEDPSPGTTTGKDGDCADSASHGFSPHHFTLTFPVLSSVPFFSFFFFFQASGSHCSFCDYRTLTRVSPRHTPHATPPSMATLPGARCSLRLEPENHCDTSSTSLSLFFFSLAVMEEALRSSS